MNERTRVRAERRSEVDLRRLAQVLIAVVRRRQEVAAKDEEVRGG